MEEEIIEHSYHQHPLKRIPYVTEQTGWNNWCYGCCRYFVPGEAAYGCRDGCSWILHEECAGMEREIRHPLHPAHLLTLAQRNNRKCCVCELDYGCLHEECAEMEREIRHPLHPAHLLTLAQRNNRKCCVCELDYGCSEGCEGLWIHLGCVGGLQPPVDEQTMSHPSHSQHELRFLRRKERQCAFQCDACGTTEKGNSYICIICQYWICESCASLQTTTLFPHHNHSLSLAFCIPSQYIMYDDPCSICSGVLRIRNWVYHCPLCRYVVHIKCATTCQAAASNIEDANDEASKGILEAPIDVVYEELIKPFVERERGTIITPRHDNDIMNAYKHAHPLRFTTFSSSKSSHDHDDDDDDEDNNCQVSEMRCDGCTMPIHDGYMSCGECKFFLHLACFNLPDELQSHPLHQYEHHKLRLKCSPDKLSLWAYCSICRFYTNGFFYSCSHCDFRLDIKCASLPDTIKHGAHKQHNHYLKLVTGQRSFCDACYIPLYNWNRYYRCDNKCRFSVCWRCALLPARNKHRLENHVLPLTYDAYVGRPGDFYCSSCEQQIRTKLWMYHCRDCDQSFHPDCCPATSGEYRNINFGSQHYQVSHHPHHSLRFQLVSKKKHCDICRVEVYDRPGFQCTSCNFVMCQSWTHEGDIRPMD